MNGRGRSGDATNRACARPGSSSPSSWSPAAAACSSDDDEAAPAATTSAPVPEAGEPVTVGDLELDALRGPRGHLVRHDRRAPGPGRRLVGRDPDRRLRVVSACRSRPGGGAVGGHGGRPGLRHHRQPGLLHRALRPGPGAPGPPAHGPPGHRALRARRLPGPAGLPGDYSEDTGCLRAAAGRRGRRLRHGPGPTTCPSCCSPSTPPTTSPSTATRTVRGSRQIFALRHGDQLGSLILDGTYVVQDMDPWYPTAAEVIRDQLDGQGTLTRLAQAVRAQPLEGRADSYDGTPVDVVLGPSELGDLAAAGAFNRAVYRDLDAAGRAWLDDGDPLPLLRLAAENYDPGTELPAGRVLRGRVRLGHLQRLRPALRHGVTARRAPRASSSRPSRTTRPKPPTPSPRSPSRSGPPVPARRTGTASSGRSSPATAPSWIRSCPTPTCRR